jgi:hypothetical protein
MDDAGEADAFLDELRPLTSEEQTRYTPSPEAAVFLANRKA